MKYKVDWNSPSQGLQSTTVEAIGLSQAREQVESMYAHVKDFRIFCVSPVFEKQDQSEPERSYHSEESYSSGGGDADDPSVMIATLGILGGIAVALYGLFTLPAGIIAMVIGGAIGWIGWKIGCWLSDRGW